MNPRQNLARLLVVIALFILPSFIGFRPIEVGRARILGSLYLGLALAIPLVERWRNKTHRPLQAVVDFSVGLTLAALGWLQTFPAGNHRPEIVTYAVCGTVILTMTLLSAGRREQNPVAPLAAV